MTLPPLFGIRWIGFGHKARAGKNLCAEAIHAEYPNETRILAFADALKAYCRVDRGMTRKDGPLLQRVGTDELRVKDPEIWLRVLYWTAEEIRPRVVLIPDLRFKNEVEFLRSMGGACVRVDRLNRDGSRWIAPDRPADHPSEIDLEGYGGWDRILVARSGETIRLKAEALEWFDGWMAGRKAA